MFSCKHSWCGDPYAWGELKEFLNKANQICNMVPKFISSIVKKTGP